MRYLKDVMFYTSERKRIDLFVSLQLSGAFLCALFGVMRRESMCRHDAGLGNKARNGRGMNVGRRPFLAHEGGIYATDHEVQGETIPRK